MCCNSKLFGLDVKFVICKVFSKFGSWLWLNGKPRKSTLIDVLNNATSSANVDITALSLMSYHDLVL